MGYNREAADVYHEIAENFGIECGEPYLGYWQIIVLAKTLAHYSTAPECEEIAARLRKVELVPDEENEEQMEIFRSLPGQRVKQ